MHNKWIDRKYQKKTSESFKLQSSINAIKNWLDTLKNKLKMGDIRSEVEDESNKNYLIWRTEKKKDPEGEEE